MSTELIARLIEAGTPPALVAEVAMALGRAAGDQEALAERRRTDRARQVIRRALLPADWEARRAVVFQRDNWTCAYCDYRGPDLHCDHVVPLARGGSNELDNLVAACAKCNASKGARSVSEWRP